MTVLFSVVKVVGEVLEVFFIVENSGDNFLNGLGVSKIFGILLENLFNSEYLSLFKIVVGVFWSFLAGCV